ncbi:DUF1120 domain-containing protein [Pseudomonas veronii]|jgi:hypothetical protein|uniref:DUF1120 domain-containing protein n=1 Tax=Pseudomonas TaxID=286 RepID=UPI000D3B48DC|nr:MULTISPECIES: DUF1120 domain-containing protein [Pseudomonas]MCT9825150.1 DUF1120 domain-containing protein [Pseudomonas veronii]NWD55142.1 DUF1120 domain-containing protein [Pseudomonas veronii]PUB27393.1 uncharacterized protein DUF1120 [Pseudomonas sp. GV105]RTY80405.1 DUF1120 domain-containing protein [Pseudomonas veronii]
MIARYLILVPLLFSQPAQAAAPVDLNVNGRIIPVSCAPSLSANGVVDFGKIAQQDLNLTTGTRLPVKSLNLTVTCNGPVRYALRMHDNRDGSAHVNSEIYYGLGLDNSANKIGVYSLTFDPQQTVVGGVAEVHGTESTTGGVAWRAANRNPINIGAKSLLGFTDTAGSTAGPMAIQNLTSTLSLETVINAKQNLDLSTDILMDGSATLEVEYL